MSIYTMPQNIVLLYNNLDDLIESWEISYHFQVAELIL